MYFFTIIDHEFFQIFWSNRARYRKYFKWEKRGIARSGKKNFSGGLMNISCIWMFLRIHIWAWTWEKKILGNKERPNKHNIDYRLLNCFNILSRFILDNFRWFSDKILHDIDFSLHLAIYCLIHLQDNLWENKFSVDNFFTFCYNIPHSMVSLWIHICLLYKSYLF